MNMDKWNTLFRRCISYVRNNLNIILDYYRSLHIGPEILFQAFPPSLCEIMLRYVSSQMNPQVLGCLFRKGIKSIRLSFYSHDIPLEKFIKISEGITYFNIGFGSMTEENLNRTISHLSNIIELDLHATNLKDSGLESIGKTCISLEILDVSFCSVTDLGIRSLCYDCTNKNETRCQNLKVLSVYHTEITARGLSFLLEYLPLLKIEVQRLLHMNMICHFVQRNFGKRLQIIDLSLSPGEEEIDVTQILLSLPNLNSLCLYKVPVDDAELISLPPFENLRRLSVSVKKSDSKLTFEEGILPFLQISGQRLKVLRLNNFQYVNIYPIGRLCQNLSSFSLYSIRHLHFRNQESIESTEPIFGNLEFMKIENMRGDPWDDCLPTIFSHCPKLNCLVISSSRSINDDTVTKIIPYLLSLKWFSISYCPNITKNSVYRILNGIPHLYSLWIWSRRDLLTARDKEEIQSYMFSNNLSISFNYFQDTEVDVSSEDYSADLRLVGFS
ncbi:uncharacterized protein [Centruroides vittatus]|uniref:uncharacterized protein n=1 Tax=Centruroides vittatus TaxID=120091 RepID=UPI0035107942